MAQLQLVWAWQGQWQGEGCRQEVRPVNWVTYLGMQNTATHRPSSMGELRKPHTLAVF